MSNTATETTTTADDLDEQPHPAAEPEPPQPDPEGTGDEQESPNAEAAKWRKKLRKAEAERDQLAEQVEALQRQQIEALVTGAGVKPAALWAISSLDALVNDDGTVSAEAVTQAIDTARDQLGVTPLGKGGAPIPGIGNRPTTAPKSPRDRFAEAFAPKPR